MEEHPLVPWHLLGAGVSASDSSRKFNRIVFACCKRDLCEGPLEEALGGWCSLPEGPYWEPTEAIVSCRMGEGEGAKPELRECGSCWVIFLVFYSQLPNTVASCCSTERGWA